MSPVKPRSSHPLSLVALLLDPKPKVLNENVRMNIEPSTDVKGRNDPDRQIELLSDDAEKSPHKGTHG